MKTLRAAVLAGVAATTVLVAPTATAPSSVDLGWELKETWSTAQFGGLSVVSNDGVWSSGQGGTGLRTSDGGQTVESVGPEGAEDLDFRDIEAFDART